MKSAESRCPAPRSGSRPVHDPVACVHCGACVGRCPVGALRRDEEFYVDFTPASCNGCGRELCF